jgi:hypothetical protein
MNNFGPVQILQHVAGHDFKIDVQIVGVIGFKHAKPIFDGETVSANQKAPRKYFAAGTPHGVDCLPGDQHGHDSCLAGTGRKLQRKAHQFWVGIFIGRVEMSERPLSIPRTRCDFHKPNRGFHRFDLTKELADVSAFAVTPMLKKPRGFRGHLPLRGIGQCAPCVHIAPNFIDR